MYFEKPYAGWRPRVITTNPAATATAVRSASHCDWPRSSGGTVLLITDQRRRDRFDYRWDRFMVRLLGSSLDRRLAAGAAPDSDRLVAIRAQMLVAPENRQALARSWARLLDAAGRSRQPGDPRIPICRDQIGAAEADVEELIVSLLVPLPVPARGVAMVMSLLRDGTGPVYNPNSGVSLGALVRRAVAELNPAIELDRSA